MNIYYSFMQKKTFNKQKTIAVYNKAIVLFTLTNLLKN